MAYALALGLIALLALALAWRYLGYVQLMRNVPAAKIRSAPQGYVELIGRARPLDSAAFHAPGSRRPCVWFEYTYHDTPAESQQDLKTARTQASFLIDDGTGSCRIDPMWMRFEPTNSAYGSAAMRPVVSSKWIEVGERIHVYGKFSSLRRDYHSLYKQELNRRLQAAKQDRALMQALDVNQDGHVDQEEWEEARRRIESEVETYIVSMQKNQGDSLVAHVLRAPDDKRLPYLVSTRRESGTMLLQAVYALFWLFVAAVAAYSAVVIAA